MSEAPQITPRPKYIRRVIRIRAEDSPNVRLGQAEQKSGKSPSNKRLLPGVLGWDEYELRRKTWDPIRQCIGLDGEFYEGRENRLYPVEWLNHGETVAARRCEERVGHESHRAMGVDVAEGGDSTAWAVLDETGIVFITSKKTPNTNVIPGETIALAAKYGVEMSKVLFDRGGGGRVHADRLRAMGHSVQDLGFGEQARIKKPRFVPFADRTPDKSWSLAQTYKNRRAEMYYELRLAFDPDGPRGGYGLPVEYSELRRQLSAMPLMYDQEGKVYLPPKKGKDGSSTQTLESILGRSPDEADAVVLAYHKLTE